MREMKDSGIEWIGEIPIKWDVAPFKKILIRNDGGLWGDEPNGQNDILVLRSTEQTIDGKWDIQSPAYRDLSNISNLQEYLVKCGDLLITKSSGSDFHIGKTTVADEYIESLSCSFSNFIQRLRVCPRINPRYYWYILNSSIARGQFVYLQNSTSGIGNINSKNINEIKVPIPPFDMQYSIVDYLDRKCSQIDAIIARQQEVIEKLKAYKLSVITEAVTKGLNPDVPMKDSGVEWIGEIPEHWENRKMISILSMRVVDGPHESPKLYDEGIPYISATAIENGKINFDLMRGYISEEYCDICDLRYKPQLHDILVIKLGASTGQVAIVETTDRFNIWVPLAAVRCNEKADPYFVYYAFQSDCFLKQMEMSWTYGTQQTLGVKSIERLRIMLPTLEEQKEIVSYLKSKCDSIDAAVKNKENLINKLVDYKKSLIYEVVTGKKEV